MKIVLLLCALRRCTPRIAGARSECRSAFGLGALAGEVIESGAIRSVDKMVIVINRLGSKVEIKTKEESVEDTAAEFVSV